MKLTKRQLKILKDMDDSWYCFICKKHLPSGAYCVENHFNKYHEDVRPIYDKEDGLINWDTHEWDLKEVKKLLRRI